MVYMRLFSNIWEKSIISFDSFTEGCTADQFMCANGQCVPVTARCNSRRECSDGSDELNCGKIWYLFYSQYEYTCCNMIIKFEIIDMI